MTAHTSSCGISARFLLRFLHPPLVQGFESQALFLLLNSLLGIWQTCFVLCIAFHEAGSEDWKSQKYGLVQGCCSKMKLQGAAPFLPVRLETLHFPPHWEVGLMQNSFVRASSLFVWRKSSLKTREARMECWGWEICGRLGRQGGCPLEGTTSSLHRVPMWCVLWILAILPCSGLHSTALSIELVSSGLAQLTLVYLQILLGFICTWSHHLQITDALFQYLLQGLGPPAQYWIESC